MITCSRLSFYKKRRKEVLYVLNQNTTPHRVNANMPDFIWYTYTKSNCRCMYIRCVFSRSIYFRYAECVCLIFVSTFTFAWFSLLPFLFFGLTHTNCVQMFVIVILFFYPKQYTFALSRLIIYMSEIHHRHRQCVELCVEFTLIHIICME